MRYFLIFIFSALLLSACQPQKPSPKGLWINSALFMVGERDTFWDKKPIFWEFGDSTLQAYQFNLFQDSLPLISEYKWKIEGNEFVFQRGPSTEKWQIVHHSADSLVLSQAASKQQWRWVFRRALPEMTEKPKLKEMRQWMHSHVLNMQGSSLPALLRIECWENKFICPDIPQSYYMPLQWNLVAAKGRFFLLFQAALSGMSNAIDVVELKQFDKHQLSGRYFKSGKSCTLSLSKNKEIAAHSTAAVAGSWQVEIDSLPLKSTPKVPADYKGPIFKKETLILSSDGSFIRAFYHQQSTGQWWLSQTQQVLLMRTGNDINYLKISTIKQDSIIGRARIPSLGNMEKEIRLVRQNNM